MSMPEIKFLPVSWTRLKEICFNLAKKILEKDLQFDRIICVSRGGLVIARIFSDYLKLPISTFTIVSYSKLGESGEPKIVEPLKVDIKNEKVLLIDEIVDKGTTLSRAISYLQDFSPQIITTLAPFVKSWSQPLPDFWQVKTDKWVIFPYETRETIEELILILGKNHLSLKEIKIRLIKLGFGDNEVNYFLKKLNRL